MKDIVGGIGGTQPPNWGQPGRKYSGNKEPAQEKRISSDPGKRIFPTDDPNWAKMAASEAIQYVTTNKDGNGVYLDMGVLYGSYVISNCMDWSSNPPVIDQDKLNAFLDAIFTQLVKDGTISIDLAFAQICDIINLSEGKSGPSTHDTISTMFNPQFDYTVGSTGENFLKYFNEYAASQAYGLTVDLSFGGAVADAADFTFPGDPVVSANALSTFMTTYKIASVDFDIEGANATALMQSNTQADVISFFQALKKQTTGDQLITLEGAVSNGPAGPLQALFSDQSTFESMFNGVNLMLYGGEGGQFYLNATGCDWSMQEWTKYAPSNQLRVGFYDGIQYDNLEQSYGGPQPCPYTIPADATSNGMAAAAIYLQFLSDCNEAGIDALGPPFFWTDDPTTLNSNPFISDFVTYYNSHSSTPFPTTGKGPPE